MDKEQKKRMANREFVVLGDNDLETTYTVQVSGNIAEIHRQIELPWDNERGTGNDFSFDRWTMSLADLKKLVASATWAIEQSETFEARHPLPIGGNDVI